MEGNTKQADINGCKIIADILVFIEAKTKKTYLTTTVFLVLLQKHCNINIPIPYHVLKKLSDSSKEQMISSDNIWSL